MQGKRLDIQGLRALAVGIVVLFHFWPQLLPGGYVGVDVFFVISGFLITGHLLREVETTGSVSVSRFWARRIRRLLPAAFTVLAASVVLTWMFLPRSLIRETLLEIGASAVYVQNWLLAGNSVDYLAADNTPTLVQHYWSLSVEEQFYIAWPLLILVALWISAKRRRGAPPRRTIAAALSIVFVASLAFSIYETFRSPASAYFVTPTRAWEFAVGGLIVFLPPFMRAVPDALRSALAWVGVLAIGGTALLINGETPFPGYVALVPVLGTALVIYAGETRDWWSTSRLFNFRPVQYLGDISYAVYLWHWPLLVSYPFVIGHLTAIGKVILLFVTVALAAATKRFIEDPARGFHATKRVPAYTFMAAGSALLLAVSLGTVYSADKAVADYAAQMEAAIATGESCLGASAIHPENDCDRPFDAAGISTASAREDTYWSASAVVNTSCTTSKLTDLMSEVECGDLDDPSNTIALVGDSHAEHFLDPVVIAAESEGWRVLMYAKPGCSGLETSRPGQDSRVEECAVWSSEVQKKLLDSSDIDTAVFSSRAKTKHVEPETAVAFWQQLRAKGLTVAAIQDVPGMPVDQTAALCIERSDETYDPCSFGWVAPTDFMYQAANAPDSPAAFIDLTDNFCDEGTCHVVIGEVVVYFDSNHVSLTYARTLAPYLREKLVEVIASE